MIDLEAHMLETHRRTKKGGQQSRAPSAQVSKTLQHQVRRDENTVEASIKIKDGVMTEEIVANKENKGQESDGSN